MLGLHSQVMVQGWEQGPRREDTPACARREAGMFLGPPQAEADF